MHLRFQSHQDQDCGRKFQGGTPHHSERPQSLRVGRIGVVVRERWGLGFVSLHLLLKKTSQNNLTLNKQMQCASCRPDRPNGESKINPWASLVAQWLRICLLMQGTRVWALVWEDATCRGATRPVSHNYWACTSGACAPQQENGNWEWRATVLLFCSWCDREQCQGPQCIAQNFGPTKCYRRKVF